MKRLVLALMLLLPSLPAQADPLRPGDLVFIALPGEEAFNKTFQVDREGDILLPEAGKIAVGGASPEEAKEKVRTVLSRVFRDLGRFDLSVKERRLLVSVLGYVKQPGSVDLPGDATVQMAIMAAGGLAVGAQLDRIQLRRGGAVTTFDYKKYLDTGDQAILPPLASMDTVFVPASPLTGNVQVDFDARTLTSVGDGAEQKTAIKVFGEVNNPGMFAHKAGIGVMDYLLRAGGVTRYAGVTQIRIISQGEPQVFNLKGYLDNPSAATAPEIAPGAIIFVPKEAEEVKSGAKIVYVMGEVFKPGAYESKPETSFLDILANAGGPTRFAETRQVRILRADGRVEPVNLQAYTEGTSTKLPSIKPGDAIFVPEKVDGEEKSWLKVPPGRAVMVMGAVQRPGRYEWSNEMSLLDLLGHAGGPSGRADTAHVQVIPPAGGNPTVFDLGRFLEKGGMLGDVPRVRAGFTIMVPELPQDLNDNRFQWTRQPADRSIHVMGQVAAPGRYAFNEGFTLLDILSAAGGPTGNADLYNLRISHNGENAPRVTPVNLARYFETGDPALLPRIRPGDVIYLSERNKPWLEESKENTVRVLGSVGKPGRYRFDDRMTLLDLLAEAGGPTDNAYVDKIVVVNLTCCRDQARSFDLVDFAKSGDFSKLPVLRAGDTVYVPNQSQSNWTVFTSAIKDAVSMLSFVVLLGSL